MRYSFICDTDDKGCGHQFCIECAMGEISKEQEKVKCPKCKKKKPVRRDFQADDITCFGPTVTVGSLADKNSAAMSNDEKFSIKETNRTGTHLDYTGPTPEGVENINIHGDN